MEAEKEDKDTFSSEVMDIVRGHGENDGKGEADEKGENASLARRNLVSSLLARIHQGKSKHKDAFERMRNDMDFAYHGYDPKLWDDDKYVVNLVQRHIQQRTAALYAKNPRAVAKPREKIHYQLWDGKRESIMQALQTRDAALANGMAVPPATAMVIEEYEKVKALQLKMEKIGRTMELLFHYFMQDAQPSFKSQMKALVRRMLTTGVGYVKLGFQRQMEHRPEVSTRMNDIMVRIDHLERLAHELKEGELDPNSAEMEELMIAMKDLANTEKVIVREGLVFDFPDPTAIIVDPLCKQLRGFVGARWVAHEMYFTPDEVEEIYGKEIGSNYTPYQVQNKSHDSSRATLANSDEDKDQKTSEGMVCVYEIYDKPSGQVFTVAEGFPDFLEEPGAPDLTLETFWPLFSLVCNEVEHHKEIYPPSDVHLLRSMGTEYNRAREGLREHRKANRPAYLTPAGLLEDEEKAKLATRPAHAVISIQGMQSGQKSEDLVTPLKTVGIDPNLYEVSSVFDDVKLAVGAQEATLGGTSGATATENSIAESARMSALGAQVDELDSFMSEIARASGAILLSEMSLEQVKRIVGDGAVWPELSSQEIADEVMLEIEAGSTGKPNQAAELRNIERVLPYLIQIPGIKPEWLAKEVLKRMDDKLDIDAALSEGVESIVAMNSMKDAQAAQGATQGAAGATNAPVQMAPGMGMTGSAQV